jgi:hypothetical protein
MLYRAAIFSLSLASGGLSLREEGGRRQTMVTTVGILCLGRWSVAVWMRDCQRCLLQLPHNAMLLLLLLCCAVLCCALLRLPLP